MHIKGGEAAVQSCGAEAEAEAEVKAARLRCESSGGGGGARQSLLDPLLTGEVKLDDEDEHASDGGGATRHSRAERPRQAPRGMRQKRRVSVLSPPRDQLQSRPHICVKFIPTADIETRTT